VHCAPAEPFFVSVGKVNQCFFCTTWKPFTFDPAEVGSIDDNGRLIFVPNQGSVISLIIRCSISRNNGYKTAVLQAKSIPMALLWTSGLPSDGFPFHLYARIREVLPESQLQLYFSAQSSQSFQGPVARKPQFPSGDTSSICPIFSISFLDWN
jgi:hypothetical protein